MAFQLLFRAPRRYTDFMPSLLIATRNAHKTAEFRAMLGARFEVTDLSAHPEIPATEETGVTFEENAALKAVAASEVFSGMVLADDSGLEVDALGGAPGVYSARYSGADADDRSNREKLLAELDRVGARGKTRSARFRCVLALAGNGALVASFDGKVEGTIINRAKGEGGFGYDPVFVPEGYCETFAQLDETIKNRESHRADALRKLMAWLAEDTH
jgi:XTP/dITP diphosphohydrolase